MSDNEPRCDCGHLFEICDSPNCPLGYPDPADRWEGWPEPPPALTADQRRRLVDWVNENIDPDDLHDDRTAPSTQND